jgi:hypothetical protein
MRQRRGRADDGVKCPGATHRKVRMLNPQSPASPNAIANMADPVSQWPFDDDLAIGCECANPALQIERWGQDDTAVPVQDFS